MSRDQPFTAEGNAVFKEPETTVHPNGSRSIRLGFRVCVMAPEIATDDGSSPAKEIARLMNLGVAASEMLAALKVARGHIQHMAAWITEQSAGYSFEGLGEDMPGIDAAIAKVEGRG